MGVAGDLCRSFLDLWWHFDPAEASLAGAPGQDGRLGAYDEASVREHLAAFRSIAAAVEDLDVEDAADEIERTALLDHVRVVCFRLEQERPHVRNPVFWTDHACRAVDALLLRDAGQAGAPAMLARLRALPRFLDDARETLTAPPSVLADAAVAQLDALRAQLDLAARRFGAAWTEAGEDGTPVVAEAEVAVDRLRLALRSELDPDPDPHAAAIGEAQVERRLHHEHASRYGAAEAWRAALRFAEEVEREVTAAAAEVQPGPWRDAFERVREDGIVPDNLLAVCLEEVGRVRELVRARRLLGDPGAPLQVAEAPGWAEVLEPIADYRGGGSEPAALLLSAPSELDDREAAEWARAELDRFRLAWLAARLGVPGRHLQASVTARLESEVRRYIASPSTLLGWGLYAEELMVQHGLGDAPASRLAERVLLLREAHLAVADLGLHTRQFTAAEAVEHLTDHLPVEHRVALADVRRLAARPLSGFAAVLGRRELLALRDACQARRGAEFDLRAFHDEVLGWGGLPVPLIRWGMDLEG